MQYIKTIVQKNHFQNKVINESNKIEDLVSDGRENRYHSWKDASSSQSVPH